MIGAYLVIAVVLVSLCRRLHRLRTVPTRAVAKPSATPAGLGAIGAVLKELWSLFVDDVWLAAGVVAFVGAVWLVRTNAAASAAVLSLFFAGGSTPLLAWSSGRRAKA